MEEVLQDSAPRYETLILIAEHTEYYEPFGFRVIQEHYFTVRCGSRGAEGKMRRLDTAVGSDVTLLQHLLKSRAPVSEIVGVVDESAVFCFNEGHRPLHYIEDLDVILCMDQDGTRLRLYDIVGTRIPSLEALLKRVPGRIEEVLIHFAPDRLAVDAEAVPYILDHGGPSYLMARGPFGAEGEAFTLPRSARA
jgi:hypothetical protein